MTRCINCGLADLYQGIVHLEGTVRGETYAVDVKGLECPNCHYKTIDGAMMPEFGRLLSDRYRSAHGLLTSDEIRARRKQLGMSQQQFAQHLGVGVASVKRWEMGKIQETRSDEDMRSKTGPTSQSTAMWENVVEPIVLSTNVGSGMYILVEMTETSLLPEADLGLDPPPMLHRTVPPHLANLLSASTRD